MNPSLRVFSLCLFLSLAIVPSVALAKRRPPPGGRLAVVGDERLSALRSSPALSGNLLRRMGRGSLVAVKGDKRSRDGIVFYKVNVTLRTGGWIQRDAVFAPSRNGDDARLLRLIKASDGFDRVVRAKIFLDNFTSSELRPEVLLVYALAAEDAANHLSRDAARRLDEKEMNAGGAPMFSYFLNFNELDRYNRQGVTFLFDQSAKQFRYDGEGWQELVHRYPRSPQALEARKRLEAASLRR
ncbi:MAG TPA: hypothetical protein VN951_10125 [Pyrinomonadaceae bacterium]|nr:hypothetical protein [Pyrinomonadaceae bacterium]